MTDFSTASFKPTRLGFLFSLVLLGLSLSFGSQDASAQGEPAEDFVKRLRAAGYFELANQYLDRLDEYPGVNSDFKTCVALEKAETFIQAAVAARSADARDEQFQNAEDQLQVFLKDHAAHGRASEARAQLGRLQMFRGSQFLTGDVDDEKRKRARELYLSAAKTFDDVIAFLKKELEGMKGARIDPDKDPEKAALRDRYRFEFLMAKHNAGEARMMAADTFEDPAKEAKPQLEEALALYTDLSERYENYVQGASAFYSRGKVEKMLGQRDKALESFTRMLEQADADELREARIGATIGLMQLALTKKKPDYNEAINQGEELEKRLRPNEKRLPVAQELRLELAKAFLAKNEDQAAKPNERKRATADARKMLLAAKKIPGPHIEETDQLLEKLGIDPSAGDQEAELPTADDPKNFDEALASARQLIGALTAMQEQADALQQSGKEAEKLKELNDSISEARQTGIIVLRRGLSMIRNDTETAQINEGRQFLAYLLMQEEQYRDSFVVGDFLAHFAPGTDIGLRGGLMALSSAQTLISSGEGSTDHWVPKLQSLGDHLVKTWPDNPDAAKAQNIMVVMTMEKGDLDEAKKLIDEMPEGPERAKFRRLLGQLWYNESLRLRADKKESEAQAILPLAAEQLQTGLDNITGGLASEEAMKAALVLAKIRLKQDSPDQAVEVLDHSKYGAITLMKKLDAKDQDFLFDLYKTELQAVVGQMTSSGGDNDALLKRASESIDSLQTAAGGEDGQKKLVSTFRVLAADIKSQIETAPPARKTKLIDAFNVFLARISEISKEDATLQWVGQTMLGMAESAMPPGQTKAQGQAVDLLNTAASTFEELKKKPNAQPTITYLLGKAKRLLGDYPGAIAAFREILSAKPTMIDAQEEAALAYEQWASTLQPNVAQHAYGSALNGGKKNIIWGWGKISAAAQRNPKMRDRFFNARYHIASCRYQQGKAAGDPKFLEQAIKDITMLPVLFPDMGGPESFQRFDTLLKKIQKDAGKPVTGLPKPEPAA